MRWRDQGQSDNVEDRRGMGGGLAIGGGGIGILILALVVWLCGGDPRALLQQAQQDSQPAVQQPGPQNKTADENKQFVSAILKTTENAWTEVLPQQAHIRYSPPKLVLFTDQINSACGNANASTGPFYCPGDQKVYLDYGFFRDLQNEFGAKGDFAQAYVIAHEVGHHVQDLLGTMAKADRAGKNNQISVALELQADCYAGVWANYVQKKGLLETGDVQEALTAASAVGDDRIQKRTQGYVVPESFTHGTSQQRMSWFSKGIQTGDIRQCQTFK